MVWSGHEAHWPFGDDDYNIFLFRRDAQEQDDHAGYTQANPDHLLMEFDSDITIDHFDEPGSGWWHQFHEAVDESDNAAHAMIVSKRVVAFGILGVDGEARWHSELHPVVALAIQVKDDPSDDVWAVYAMNWGNEGYCHDHIEVYPSSAPIAFLLPRPGATLLDISYDLRCNSPFSDACSKTRTGFTAYRDRGVQVWFQLPETHYELLSTPFGSIPFLYAAQVWGELHLHWAGAAPSRSPTPPLSTAPLRKEADHEPEAVLPELVARMTPAQRSVFNRLLPKPPTKPQLHTMRLTMAENTKPPQPSTTVLPGMFKQLPDEDWRRRQKQVIEALRAAYGGSLPPPFK